jgi:hypothetical protein
MTNAVEMMAPLKLLSRLRGGGSGTGALGAVLARAGVGKTACLISLALGRMMMGDKVVHVSLGETPDKVTAHYNLILGQMVKASWEGSGSEPRDIVEKNRLILAFLRQSFDGARLKANLENLRDRLAFVPGIIIVDGLDFETCGRALIEQLKEIAIQSGAQMWFSVRSHRHLVERNERGIPFPLGQVDDLFDFVLEIEQDAGGILLKAIKGGGSSEGPAVVRCNSYFIAS